MIHGVPAESVSASIAAAKNQAQARVQQEQPAGGPAGGEEAGAGAAPEPESKGLTAKRLQPPDPAGSGEGPGSRPPPQGKTPHEHEPGPAAEENSQKGETRAGGLTQAEKAVVRELKVRDRQVKNHEQAHIAAGTGNIVRGAQYTYQRGPDGRLYAMAGDVRIDVSPVPGDPEATIEKAEAVYKAALAPARPSAQDRQVAARAMQMKMEAMAEKSAEEIEEKKEEKESGRAENSDAPEKAGRQDTNSPGLDVFA